MAPHHPSHPAPAAHHPSHPNPTAHHPNMTDRTHLTHLIPLLFFSAGGVAGGIPTVTKSATGHSCACAPRHADRVLYNFAHGPSSCAFPSNHLLNALWLDQIREAERVSPGDPSSRERLLGRNRGFVCNYANLQPCKLDFLIYRILFGIRIVHASGPEHMHLCAVRRDIGDGGAWR